MPRVTRPLSGADHRIVHTHSRDMLEPDDVRFRLMAITDDLRDHIDGLVARACAAERGGATMLLVRLKHADARTLADVGRALVTTLQIPVLISERLDVALACGAAGVHLNAASVPVMAVRPHVPEGFLIGGSISSLADVERARDADFVTIGPVYGAGAAALGADGFRELANACGRPGIAIGGIDTSTVAEIAAAGASGIAVIRAVLGSADPEQSAAALRAAFVQRPVAESS